MNRQVIRKIKIQIKTIDKGLHSAIIKIKTDLTFVLMGKKGSTQPGIT